MSDKKDVAKKEANQWPMAWEPLAEAGNLRRAISHLFRDTFGGDWLRNWDVDLEGGRAGWFPTVDVQETDKEYVIKADVPGMDKDDVQVEVEKGMLKIKGERKEDKELKEKNYLRKEHFYGSFRRSFPLPSDAKTEDVKADYKNGVLTIHIARSEEMKPKTVKINGQ